MRNYTVRVEIARRALFAVAVPVISRRQVETVARVRSFRVRNRPLAAALQTGNPDSTLLKSGYESGVMAQQAIRRSLDTLADLRRVDFV